MRVGFFISSLSGGGAEKVLITIAQSMADNNIGSVSITSLEKRPQFYQVDEEKVELYKIKNKHRDQSILGRFCQHKKTYQK